VNQLRSSRSRG